MIIVVIFVLVNLSEEDVLGALLQGGHSHGATHASVRVVSVKVADHAESLWRGFENDKVLRGEAVVADERMSELRLDVVVLTLQVERQANLRNSRKGRIRLDSGDCEGNAVEPLRCAIVPHLVPNERVTGIRRQVAVMLILPVTTVLRSVADKQSTDALRVGPPAVEVVLPSARVLLEQLDAVLEHERLDLVAGVESRVQLLIHLVEAVRDPVEPRVQVVVLILLLLLLLLLLPPSSSPS